MIKVQFYSVDEFLNEVRCNARQLEGGIVRVAQELRKPQARINFKDFFDVFIVATAVVHRVAESGYPASRWLLRLDKFCCEAFMDKPAEAMRYASNLVAHEIGEAVHAAGLATRPGVFSDEGNS